MARSVAVGAGRGLREYVAYDFTGGLDVVTSPTLLAAREPQNRLIEAINVTYNPDGSVSKRWGFEQVTATSLDDGQAIEGGVWFRKSDGTEQTIVGTRNGGVCKVVPPNLVLLAGVGAGRFRWSFAVYQDTLFIAHAAGAPQQYDGTTVSFLGGGAPATASQFVAHGNRLFATDGNNPSRLYWSKLNNPLDWSGTDDAGFMDVQPNDLGIIKALVPSIQELAILKTFRPYRLQGIGPTTGYTVQNSLTPASGSIGCTNLSAAAFAVNDVWYMSQQGVHRISATDQFGDLTSVLSSALVEPYFTQDQDLQPYGVDYRPYAPSGVQTFPHYDMAYMVAHDAYNNLMFYGQKSLTPYTPYTCMDRFLVYDLRLKNWAVWQVIGPLTTTEDYAAEFTYMWPSMYQAATPEMLFGMVASVPTSMTGRTTKDEGPLPRALPPSLQNTIVSNRRGIKNDAWIASGAAVQPIRASFAHVSALGNPGMLKCPRHIYLYFAEQDTPTTITLEITYDFADTPQFTTTFQIHSSIRAERQITKRIDLGAAANRVEWHTNICEFMTIRISNARLDETFRFQGYRVFWSPRRFIRRSE